MYNFPAHLVLAAFVAFVDTLPPVFKQRPPRYCWALFFQTLVTGLVVFSIDLPLVPWWALGTLVALFLAFPSLLLPPMRGAYRWTTAVGNYALVGLVFSLLRHFLAAIAHSFT
jgi:TctA family transporter